MRLPEPEQGQLFAGGYWPNAETALQEFLSVAEWAGSSSSGIDDLVDRFAETTKRRVALRALKPFVPRKHGGIDYLELYGPVLLGQRKIHLSQSTTERIADAFESAISEQEERYEGEIREMDLDKQSFRLRNVPLVNEVLCRFGDELVSTSAELLGRRVRVIGVRATSKDGVVGPLDIVDLEKVETKGLVKQPRKMSGSVAKIGGIPAAYPATSSPSVGDL